MQSLTTAVVPKAAYKISEMVLMKLCGRLQIWTLNNVSLPFASNDTGSDQEESPMADDTDDSVEESPTTHETDNTDEKSPMAWDPNSTDEDKESPTSQQNFKSKTKDCMQNKKLNPVHLDKIS